MAIIKGNPAQLKQVVNVLKQTENIATAAQAEGDGFDRWIRIIQSVDSLIQNFTAAQQARQTPTGYNPPPNLQPAPGASPLNNQQAVKSKVEGEKVFGIDKKFLPVIQYFYQHCQKMITVNPEMQIGEALSRLDGLSVSQVAFLIEHFMGGKQNVNKA